MTEPTPQYPAPPPDPAGEPPRQPADESAGTPTAGTPTAGTPTAGTPTSETATAGTSAMSEAVATAEAMGTPETAPGDGAPIETPGSAAVAATATASGAATTTIEETPAAVAGPGRRTAILKGMRTLVTALLSVLLFAGGIALGNYIFQTDRPAPVGGVEVSPIAEGLPAVAQEFVAALAANDADALRSSLDKDPHLDLTREMTKFGIQRVDNVEVLGTQVDGERSATEILMQYESTDGTPFAINLVILVDGGKIEGFR